MMILRMLGAKWRNNAFVVALLVPAVVLFSLQRHLAVDCFRFPNNNINNNNNNNINNSAPNHLKNRRKIIASLTQFTSLVLLDPRMHRKNANALSLPFGDQQQNRRQKELCLVNLLRLQFWADTVSEKFKTLDMDDEESRKRLYMEARLGSKVMVASSKKISGGATANVFMLKSLYLRECLDDLTYYADKNSKKQMDQYKDDLIESIASIVEFDGLETTLDDSPRSTLTLSMYNSQKSIYVQRMLGERIVPLTDDILRLFGPEARVQTDMYMREFYPSEIRSTKPVEIKPTDPV